MSLFRDLASACDLAVRLLSEDPAAIVSDVLTIYRDDPTLGLRDSGALLKECTALSKVIAATVDLDEVETEDPEGALMTFFHRNESPFRRTVRRDRIQDALSKVKATADEVSKAAQDFDELVFDSTNNIVAAKSSAKNNETIAAKDRFGREQCRNQVYYFILVF